MEADEFGGYEASVGRPAHPSSAQRDSLLDSVTVRGCFCGCCSELALLGPALNTEAGASGRCQAAATDRRSCFVNPRLAPEGPLRSLARSTSWAQQRGARSCNGGLRVPTGGLGGARRVLVGLGPCANAARAPPLRPIPHSPA